MFSHDSATNGSPHVVLRDDLLAAYPFLCACPMVTGIVRGASFLDIGSAVFFYILEVACLKRLVYCSKRESAGMKLGS